MERREVGMPERRDTFSFRSPYRVCGVARKVQNEPLSTLGRLSECSKRRKSGELREREREREV
jgi:hypothetical protein